LTIATVLQGLAVLRSRPLHHPKDDGTVEVAVKLIDPTRHAEQESMGDATTPHEQES
jgi:hypothetical protein